MALEGALETLQSGPFPFGHEKNQEIKETSAHG